MHNQVPSDSFQQPAAPAAAPQTDAPQVAPAAPPPYTGSDLPPHPYVDPAAYGQHPGYPPAPPAAPGTNGFAIAALVASICGGFGLGSVLGLAFGITALVQLKRRPQKGRGLAVTALVISGLTLVVGIAVLVGVIVEDMRNSAAGIEKVEATELKPGDCISSMNTSSAVHDLPVVSCSQPHDAEVYHVFAFPSGRYPGAAAVEQESEARCGAAFEPYSGPLNENLEIYYLIPQSSADWRRDRGVVCIAFDPDGTRIDSLVN